jgi:hypothetical protein
MPTPDLAITASGNIAVLQNGALGLVAGNTRIAQELYIAMVEMPTQLVIGKQFKSVLQIEEDLRNYLDSRLANTLPFPASHLRFRIRRNADESISTTILFPTSEGDVSNPVDLKFQGRNGYQAQLVYNFRPILDGFPSIVTQVTERVVIEKTAIRIPLVFDYSGRGPVLFFPEDSNPSTGSVDITITKIPKVRKYNILDEFDGDGVVDTVQILSGTELLEERTSDVTNAPSLAPFENGTPFLYFKDGVDDTLQVTLRLNFSNCESFSRSADIVVNPNTEHVFGMKLTQNISLALLNSPLQPGVYKAVYNARIRYRGNPD